MPARSIDFRGTFTAITTPFTPDASAIDYARLDAQIAFQARGGVQGIVVSGTTGESPTLEHDEYRELLARAVASGHAHGLIVIAGTGSNSTAHAVAMQRLAAQAGADGGLSVNPYYNKPTQEGLYRHFMAVADASDLPVMLYNIPGRSAGGLTLETIKRLAAHPNIRAIKDAVGSVDFTAETCAQVPELAVLSGDDPLTLPMIAVGAVGVVSVLSNLVPDRTVALVRAALEASPAGAETAREIHRELLPLMKALFTETNPIPLKAAMKLLGRDSGSLRLPMTPAGPATVERLRHALTNMELLRQPVPV
jgi:4-hydroxy-tetrahydrodipicolinate synthase